MIIFGVVCIGIAFAFVFRKRREPNYFMWIDGKVHKWNGEKWVEALCSDIQSGDIIY